jgi:hypothetical protein
MTREPRVKLCRPESSSSAWASPLDIRSATGFHNTQLLKKEANSRRESVHTVVDSNLEVFKRLLPLHSFAVEIVDQLRFDGAIDIIGHGVADLFADVSDRP